MKIQKINELKLEFLKYLQEGDRSHLFLLRKAIQNWQSKFDLESGKLSENIDVSLDTKVAGRLWEGEHNSMKSGLMMLVKNNPIFGKALLEDLFNENMDISMRLNRYLFHCDQIFDEIKQSTKKINTHHQNYYSGSLIATLQYPHLYVPFEYHEYRKLMECLGTHDIPLEQEMIRYMKTMRNLSKVIQNDEEFMQKYYTFLPEDSYLGPSCALSYEMMIFLSEKK